MNNKTNLELINEYREYLQAHGLVRNSIKSYSSQLHAILKSNALSSISKLHKFINYRRSSSSQRTFNLTLIVMTSFSKFVNIVYGEDSYYPSNVLVEISSIKSYTNPVNVQERIAYSDDQVHKIMNTKMAAWRWQTLFTAFNLGLRSNQIRTLKLSDIDLENKLVNVRAENSKNKKKISIPLGSSTFRVIKNWVEPRRMEPLSVYYIENKPGKIISERSMSYWDPQNNNLDFRVKLHNCRYTFATNLWKATFDLVLVQRMLGHSNPVITSVYLKLTDEDIHSKFRKLDYRVGF